MRLRHPRNSGLALVLQGQSLAANRPFHPILVSSAKKVQFILNPQLAFVQIGVGCLVRSGGRFNRLYDQPGQVSESNPLLGAGIGHRGWRTNDPEMLVVKDMPGQEKMSQVILDFAKPLLELSDDVEWKMTILDVAIVAWNFSLLPPEEQSRASQELDETFDTDEAKDVFEFLLQRKEESFLENHRVIVDYTVHQAGNKLKFNVISTPKLDA